MLHFPRKIFLKGIEGRWKLWWEPQEKNKWGTVKSPLYRQALCWIQLLFCYPRVRSRRTSRLDFSYSTPLLGVGATSVTRWSCDKTGGLGDIFQHWVAWRWRLSSKNYVVVCRQQAGKHLDRLLLPVVHWYSPCYRTTPSLFCVLLQCLPLE